MAKILISVSKDTKIEVYEAAVRAAGGEPTALYLPQWDSQYDGLLLGGGVDMDPKYFGEPIDGTEEIDSDRDAAEIKLLEACLAEGKPVLGICRGHQVMNVYFGGTQAQWDAIRVGVENENLSNLLIHYGTAMADTHNKTVTTVEQSCETGGGTFYRCSCGARAFVCEQKGD